MTGQFLIYALVDPRSGERFYVGQSSRGMLRPRQHTKAAALKEMCPKAFYVRKLAALGLKPMIEVLQYLDNCDESIPPPLHCYDGRDVDALNAAEMWWIVHGNIAGWPLTNRTDGGEGARGMVITETHRANMSKAAKGRPKAPFSDEHKARISASSKGKKKSAEHIAKMAATLTGKKQSPESIAKRSAALMGRGFTVEQRARISNAVKNSPKAIAQREQLRMSKFGKKHPPRSAGALAKMKALGDRRRGIPMPEGHSEKIKAAKAITRIGRHFALLLAGLATIR